MGSGFKDFAAGDVLTAADVDGYLMRQTVMTFADASARDSALSGVLDEGMVAYLEDSDTITVYDGSAWRIYAPGGLIPLSETSFSGSSTAQFTSAFTSTYTNYRVVLSLTSSAAFAIYLRWLNSTTAASGNILSIEQRTQLSAGTLSIGTRSDQYGLVGNAFPTYTSNYTINIFGPQATDYSSYQAFGVTGRSNTDSDMVYSSGRNIVTTSFDGFEITTAGGPNLSGTMTLYGVRNG
jgi:hypothetical protein